MRTTFRRMAHLLKLALSAGLLWSGSMAAAQETDSLTGAPLTMTSAKDDDTWVEIEFLASELVPYLERRPTNQISFGFQYEPLVFENYLSVIDGIPYNVAFGQSTTDLMQVSLGWKLNLPIIAFDIQGVYGRGTMQSEASGQRTTFAINKKGLKANLVIDGIFSENYIVPYGGIQYIQWDLETSNDVASVNLTTASTMGITAGVLIAMNWLDDRSALTSFNDSRLNNTYVDVFYTQYPRSGNQGDPNLASTAFGAGFKLEF